MAKTGKFTCQQCGRSFSMAAHLGRHTSTIHGARAKSAAPPHRRRGRPRRAATRSGPAALNGTVRLMQDMRAYRDSLAAQRAQLDAQLDGLERALAALGGGASAARPRPTGAAKRAVRPAGGGLREGSLKDYIGRVLQSHGAAMAVKDVTAGVRKAGYPTRNQTLSRSVGIALADMPNVKKVSRGMFRAR